MTADAGTHADLIAEARSWSGPDRERKSDRLLVVLAIDLADALEEADRQLAESDRAAVEAIEHSLKKSERRLEAAEAALKVAEDALEEAANALEWAKRHGASAVNAEGIEAVDIARAALEAIRQEEKP